MSDLVAPTENVALLKEKEKNPLKRLYYWVLHWAETPYGIPALAILAFAESSFFPIPPDVLLIALILGLPRKAWRYALVCTIMSVIGGIFGYGIGWGFWEITKSLFIPYIFSQRSFEEVCILYEKWNFWVVFTAGFTPIPYKLITISAGVCKINFFIFIVASAVGRAGRFYLVAALLRWCGPKIREFIDKYFNLCTVVFMILLIGGFLVVKYLI